MKFCPSCAAPVVQRIPEGDHLPRSVCTACGTIHYCNPKLVTGCVPEHEGRILICRRAIEPRRGYWTIPAGFMEVGETLQQAAARECQEEALASVEIGDLCAIVHVLHAEQVHVMFRALSEPRSASGPRASRRYCARNATALARNRIRKRRVLPPPLFRGPLGRPERASLPYDRVTGTQ
jgi:ADP-ribose pyrophosphatase YjhB (NUDIX family)